MVQQTSIQSYHSLDDKHENYGKIMRALLMYGPCYDNQIVALTGLPINVVTGRRNDLIKEGLVVEAGRVWNENTHRNVMTWKLAKDEPEPMVTKPEYIEPVLNESQWQMAV